MRERIEKKENKQLNTKTDTEIAMNSSMSILLAKLKTLNDVSIRNENPIKLVEAFKIWPALFGLFMTRVIFIYNCASFS